jgi:hypothetical protein
MRLTLRTMLAYMDDILDPADHEQLGHKIETSDFATELIHRSRDTLRRLRLGAPDVLEPREVIEDSSWVDPNKVAEYLDNTLAAEKVAEYERVCLESDVNLAEVASCHHILTMVLGEPTEVDEKVRQRLYGLSDSSVGSNQLRIERAHGESDQPEDSQQQGALLSTETRQTVDVEVTQNAETGVPDYLKEASRSRRRKRRWLVAAASLVGVLGVVGVVGYFVSGAFTQPELPSELADIAPEFLTPEVEISGLKDLAGEDPQALSTEAAPFVVEPSIESAPLLGQVPVESGPETGQESVAAAIIPPGGSSPTSTEGVVTKPLLSSPDSESAEHDTPAGSRASDSTNDADIASGTAANLGEVVNLEEGTVEKPALVPADARSPEIASTAGSELIPGGPMRTHSLPTREGSESLTMKNTGKKAESPSVTTDPEALEPEETGPIQLGNYLGNNDVLVRFDPQQGAWVRMPPRSNLFTGERLLTLPKFRTQVVLAGLNLSLSGGTQIFLPTDVAFLGNDTGFSGGGGVEAGHDDLWLEMIYGRMLFNASLNGSGVVLKVGDLVCWLQMGGSAGLAVEVNRQFVPGRDAEEEPAPIVATWYLTSGTLQMSIIGGDDPGQEQTIQSPATWSFVDGVVGLPQLIGELPAWIDREPVMQTERRALTVLDDELVPGEPVGIRLLELNDRRQREVRTLAAQCSLYVGEFEPFIKALNDDQQKAAWKTLLELLRQAMALSPDKASQLREAFVMRRGEEAADDLMRMVRGYDKESIGLTPEAIKNGILSKLIGWLDHDSLDYRVLAYFNLQEITGKSIGYRPEFNAKQRQRGIRTWRKRLESGELLPVE